MTAHSGERPELRSVDPSTGEVIYRTAAHTSDQLDAVLERAVTAQADWRRATLDERSRGVRAFGNALTADRASIAALITSEMGKPITEAEAEIDKSVRACEYYADHGPEHLAPEAVETGFDHSVVRFDPRGTILAIMPWNFPVWQVVRLLAPAVLAGNSVVLKHASNVSQCALALERIARASLPADVFQVVLCKSDAVNQLLTDERVAAVSLTGSTSAGAEVAAVAGHQLKPQVLELGGSDAFIVLPDADVLAAAAAGVSARFMNAGQSCVAAKRFIVHDAVFDAFVDQFISLTRQLQVGDPRDRATQMGPLARPDLRTELVRQITSSVDRGARVTVGGQSLPGPGNFFAPAVVVDMNPEMPLVSEETFGPVAPMLRVTSDDEATTLANASEFGLAASVWTTDPVRAGEFAAQLEVGSVFVNSRVSSDPRLPFGGVKRSGYGRELGSFGIRELTNIKAVAGNGAAPGRHRPIEPSRQEPAG